MSITPDMYINTLPDNVAWRINVSLWSFFIKEGYSTPDTMEACERAMDGRLCDISDLIDIQKYCK